MFFGTRSNLLISISSNLGDKINKLIQMIENTNNTNNYDIFHNKFCDTLNVCGPLKLLKNVNCLKVKTKDTAIIYNRYRECRNKINVLKKNTALPLPPGVFSDDASTFHSRSIFYCHSVNHNYC